MLKVIELFAGIGAQRKALQKAKIEHEVIAISEIDKFAIKAYNAIHGETLNLGDITKIDRLPKADLWTYSFPCTDISLAGKMNGFEKNSGTHSSLLWEVERLLKISYKEKILPKYLLMENVKNIISKKFKAQFDNWCKYLESLGYKNFYQVLNAKDYGIPQNRERVFMVSIRESDKLFEFPTKIALEKKLKDFLEKKVDEKYYLSLKLINYFTNMEDNNGFIRGKTFTPKYVFKDEVAKTITTRAGNRICDNFIVEPAITLDGKVAIPQTTKDGYEVANIEDGIYKKCSEKLGVVQKDKIPTLKTSTNDIGVVVIKNTENYIQWEKEGLFDVACIAYKEDKICGTISTCNQMKVITNNVVVRKLTPLECLRLMGFDDVDYFKLKELKISDTQIYKMAGNSIVVNCLTKIFEKLKEII